MLQVHMKVKMISEFMARFNLSELPPNLSPDDTLIHEKALAMLFDQELIDRRQDDAWRLVQLMKADERNLSFTDTAWHAEALCSISLNGRNDHITLKLQTEHIKGFRYKWVIADAWGKPLELTPKKTNPGLRINPVDNEVNFLSLHNITKNEFQNILNYKANDRELDRLSVFLTLVQFGILKINHVEKIIYQFTGNGYHFTVSEFHREGLNTGWLISNFTIE